MTSKLNSSIKVAISTSTLKFDIELTVNNSVALPLLSTSISRVFDKKSLNSFESFSGLWISGVPFVAIR